MQKPAGAAGRVEVRPDLGRLSKRLALVLLLLAVVAGGLVVWLAYFTNACAIQKVTVTGNKNLTPDYIRQVSGASYYKNLVTVPVGKLEKNLERDPWISDARIGRHLMHTLNIDVKERQPVALLDFGGACFLVDGSGYVITSISADKFPQLPRVYGGDAPPPRVGERVTDARTAECIKVISGMPQEIRDMIQLGNPFDGRGQVFVSRLGYNIVYGKASELSKKNEILQAIALDVRNNKRKIAYIDVRVPDSPVIMPK